LQTQQQGHSFEITVGK